MRGFQAQITSTDRYESGECGISREMVEAQVSSRRMVMCMGHQHESNNVHRPSMGEQTNGVIFTIF